MLTPAPGILLVASPTLVDPNFRRSVVFVVEHSDDGTLGFIINRPLDIPLGELWGECPPGLAACLAAADGGPVERDKGLLLHRDLSIPDAATMGHGIAIGGELSAIARRWADGPDRLGPRLFLGHSGWGPGQLEQECSDGAWLLRPAKADLLFPPPELVGDRLWEQLSQALPRGGLSEPSLN